jgi:adenylate kinase family enzyme
MRRILIIGPGGSGKSTLARRIGDCTGLPVVHLDSMYWKEGWVETPKEEWARVVQDLAAREAWVMDGNYGGTLDLRLAVADTVVFLDLPRWVCLWRVVKRRIWFHGRSRPDMCPGCPERLSWAFLKWIWSYPRARRPGILQRLQAAASAKRVIILDSRAAVRRAVEGFCREAA